MIENLDCEKIPLSLYSPNLTLSDYDLLWNLQNHLNVLLLKTYEWMITTLSAFFSSKSKDFYKNDIMNLVNC